MCDWWETDSGTRTTQLLARVVSANQLLGKFQAVSFEPLVADWRTCRGVGG